LISGRLVTTAGYQFDAMAGGALAANIWRPSVASSVSL